MDDAEALMAPPLPPLVSKEEISRRLRLIYPEGLENREHVMKPTTAATVFTALYIGSVASKKGKSNRWLAPRHVVRMTDDIAADQREEARHAYSTRTPPSSNNSWYADNSRETIRDESIRQGLIQLNGMIKRSDVKTSSGAGRYALCDHFVALFDPDLEGDEMIERIAEWQKGHLAVSALMRSEMAKTAHGHAVVVVHPSSQGGTTVLPFGESPAITKAVVEEFAPRFMGDPVVLWISDSEKRVIDDKLVKRLKIPISAEKMLPDVILADIEGDKIKIVLVEVVSTDGAVTTARKAEFLKMIAPTGLTEEDVFFVTAYNDRGKGPATRALRELAWGSFVWFRSEPDRLVQMISGKPKKLAALISDEDDPHLA